MSHSYIGTNLNEKLLAENTDQDATQANNEEHKQAENTPKVEFIPDSFSPQYAETYSGFVGLQTTIVDFKNHVMLPIEVKNFFSKGQRYEAPFVYPFLPADGFGKPVVFSAEELTDAGFTLKAAVLTNKHPESCLAWLAGNIFLPESYTMKDRIQFFTDTKNGFGHGAFYISTIDCRLQNGKEAWIAKICLTVKNRPGLFLKVANKHADGFYEDVAIFFPDKIESMMHKPVQYGEAFVLVPEGNPLSDELITDIRDTFNKLVKKSYGNAEGLFCVETHQPVENFLPKPR